MKRVLCAGLCVCMFFAPAVSFASVKTPTITGSTGLIKMPTADVLSSKDFNVGVDYVFDGTSATTGTISDIQGEWIYKANVGSFMGYTKGMELGFVGRTEKVTNRFKEGVFINLKYSLASSDDPDALKLAIGVENLTSLAESDAYMVASKSWTGGAGVHFGAMFDFPNYNKFRPIGMLGLNMPLGTRAFSIMAEVFSGESIFQVDAGLEYSVNNNFSLLARGLNLTNSDNARNTKSYSAGISLANFF
ncbi:MAG: hypothetical protein WC527_01950 [Candidatus Margulisiibacteriota bacterium]